MSSSPDITPVDVVSGTPWSSCTRVERTSGEQSPIKSPLDQEIELDELRFEKYGGDDIHEPPSKSDMHSTHSSEDEAKLNLVTWDGPDDPMNPQHWSKLRKWLITIICSVMTLNVYVRAI
jgi:DHA1 family multidrug resistance protein-like MFS transporter